MNFSLNTTGFDKLQDAITKYTETVTEGVKDALAQTANDIVESAKGNTSGALADSINADIADDGLSATITANSQDAVFVEYGVTVPEIKPKNAKALHFKVDGEDVFAKKAKEHTNPPKPFLNPAFEENRQNVIDSIAQTLQ